MTDDTHPRPVVQAFALHMERKLRANDHKGGWCDESEEWLLARLYEEVAELALELKRYDHPPATRAQRMDWRVRVAFWRNPRGPLRSPLRTRREARGRANVASVAMCEVTPRTPSPLAVRMYLSRYPTLRTVRINGDGSVWVDGVRRCCEVYSGAIHHLRPVDPRTPFALRVIIGFVDAMEPVRYRRVDLYGLVEQITGRPPSDVHLVFSDVESAVQTGRELSVLVGGRTKWSLIDIAPGTADERDRRLVRNMLESLERELAVRQ